MSMAGDDIVGMIRDRAGLLSHFHVSEPNLAPVYPSTLDHRPIADALRAIGYDRWVSIEMRTQEPFDPRIIDQVIGFVKQAYDIG